MRAPAQKLHGSGGISCRLFIIVTPPSTVIGCSTVRQASGGAHVGSVARISDQLLHVPQSGPGARRPLPRDRTGSSGFGLSDAPPVGEFDYTFDALTDLTAGLLRSLGVERCAIYVQDYGAPIGWRLALREPSAITAIISQSGNGYDAGFVESFWKVVQAYQTEQTPDTEAPCGSSSHWTPPGGSTSPV